MTKRMILVTSPPASGKTFVSQQLAKRIPNVVYLDKDALIPLSKQIFAVAGEPINRSSQFFEENIRNFEYEAILDIGFEALKYADVVLINAPFTREVKDNEYFKNLRTKLSSYNAALMLIWVVTDIEVSHKRMLARNSPRDTWKLANWDEYIKSRDYSVPDLPALSGCLVKFFNSNNVEFNESMERITKYLLEE